MPKDLLSFDEAAEMLEISRTALYDLIKAGDAPTSKRIGKHTVFDAASVKRLKLKRQKINSNKGKNHAPHKAT